MEVTGPETIDEEADIEVVEAGTEVVRDGEVGEEEVIIIETTDTEITGMKEVETTGEIEEMIETIGEMTAEDIEEMTGEEDETGMMITEKEAEVEIMIEEIETTETGHGRDPEIGMRDAGVDLGAQEIAEESPGVKTGPGGRTRSQPSPTQLRTLALKTGLMMILVRTLSLLLLLLQLLLVRHPLTKVMISMLMLLLSWQTLTNNFFLRQTEVMRTKHLHKPPQIQLETKQVSCENLH